MNKVVVFVVSALALMTSSCATPWVVASDDTQIIRVVLDEFCKKVREDGSYVLSSDAAVVDEFFTPRQIETTARRSLIERNATSQALPAVAACESGLHRVDQAQLSSAIAAFMRDSLRSSDQWTAFYAIFPDSKGIVRMSVPGYSTNKDGAVIQVSVACGDTCKSVSFWVLRKVGTRWEVSESVDGAQS